VSACKTGARRSSGRRNGSTASDGLPDQPNVRKRST
jgi:hypothetical protein